MCRLTYREHQVIPLSLNFVKTLDTHGLRSLGDPAASLKNAERKGAHGRYANIGRAPQRHLHWTRGRVAKNAL